MAPPGKNLKKPKPREIPKRPSLEAVLEALGRSAAHRSGRQKHLRPILRYPANLASDMGQASHRVLIVDDEPALLKMMAVFLGRQGFIVTDVGTTEEAWSTVEAARGEFDVAVLDGTMAGIGVEELALRMLSANPKLRVLAASGYPVDMTSLEAAAPGRVAFLQKPFGPAALAGAVRRLVGAEEKNL